MQFPARVLRACMRHTASTDDDTSRTREPVSGSYQGGARNREEGRPCDTPSWSCRVMRAVRHARGRCPVSKTDGQRHATRAPRTRRRLFGFDGGLSDRISRHVTAAWCWEDGTRAVIGVVRLSPDRATHGQWSCVSLSLSPPGAPGRPGPVSGVCACGSSEAIREGAGF
jgi:hypothetical protein